MGFFKRGEEGKEEDEEEEDEGDIVVVVGGGAGIEVEVLENVEGGAGGLGEVGIGRGCVFLAIHARWTRDSVNSCCRVAVSKRGFCSLCFGSLVKWVCRVFNPKRVHNNRIGTKGSIVRKVSDSAFSDLAMASSNGGSGALSLSW